MANQLSGIAIIIFIAFGVLTFILLFIFAKRQITRFALKSRRGPHVPIGTDAPRKLLRELERRLNSVRKVQGEPPLLTVQNLNLFLETPLKEISPPHLYRMKVFEDVKRLDALMTHNVSRRRHPCDEVQSYYLKLYKDKMLPNLSLADLNKFLYLYERARHEPQEFSVEDYQNFITLLENVQNSLCGNDAPLCLPTERNLTLGDNEEPHSMAESTSLALKKSVSFDICTNKPKNSTALETPV